MKLSTVNFPVFQIAKDTSTTRMGTALVVLVYDRLQGEEQIRYIDDTSYPADTLGRRRLLLKADGKTLHKLTDAVYFIGDLIKLAKVSNRFIDSSGRIFEYTKTRSVPLKFFELDEVLQIPTGGSIVSIKGMPQRFKTLATIPATSKFAGILEISSRQMLLYGIYTNKEKDTWRKI